MGKKPHGAGKSSYELVDTDLLFSEIGLQQGSVFLDVACGMGAYSLKASERVGDTGIVYAFDLWEPGINELKQRVQVRGITNIETHIVDVGKRIPVEKESVDIALMSMILHDLVRDNAQSGALREVRRVLKPTGRLAVVEFKKKDGPPGPPITVRLSPKSLESFVLPHAFQAVKTLELGPHSYLTVFTPR